MTQKQVKNLIRLSVCIVTIIFAIMATPNSVLSALGQNNYQVMAIDDDYSPPVHDLYHEPLQSLLNLNVQSDKANSSQTSKLSQRKGHKKQAKKEKKQKKIIPPSSSLMDRFQTLWTNVSTFTNTTAQRIVESKFADKVTDTVKMVKNEVVGIAHDITNNGKEFATNIISSDVMGEASKIFKTFRNGAANLLITSAEYLRDDEHEHEQQQEDGSSSDYDHYDDSDYCTDHIDSEQDSNDIN